MMGGFFFSLPENKGLLFFVPLGLMLVVFMLSFQFPRGGIPESHLFGLKCGDKHESKSYIRSGQAVQKINFKHL